MTMQKIIASLLLSTVLLQGCSTLFPTPKTPAQAVYELDATYTAALAVAVQYKALPACGGGVPICSDAAIVAKLQKADDVAEPAIKAAEAAVRVPETGDVASVLYAAQTAVGAFVAITAALKTH